MRQPWWRWLIFIALFLITLWGMMALPSITLLASSQYNCSPTNNMSLAAVQAANNSTTSFCFCQANQNIYFTNQSNATFNAVCGGIVSDVAIQAKHYIFAALVGCACNLGAYFLLRPVTFLILGLPLASRAATQSLMFFLHLIIYIWNLLVVPILISAKWGEFRPINTINFLLSGDNLSTPIGFYDVSRLWIVNMSVWFCTHALLLVIVPWLELLLGQLGSALVSWYLIIREGEFTQATINHWINVDWLDCARLLAGCLAGFSLACVMGSAIPLLYPILFLAALNNMIVLLFRSLINPRDYLPAPYFLVKVLRCAKWALVAHAICAEYFYGAILTPSPVYYFSLPTLTDFWGRIIGQIHMFVFALILTGLALLEQPFLNFIAGDNQEDVQRLVHHSSEKSYKLEHRSPYECFAGVLKRANPNYSRPVSDSLKQSHVLPDSGVNISE